MSETRQRILDAARRLFNREGVHRVGVREVARAVGISPGNLAYHFATKDELVAALVTELHEVNLRTVFADLPATVSLASLYRMALASMRNMLDYRFVLLGYVDAARRSPALQKLEAQLARKRRERHRLLVAGLIAGGWINRRALTRSERLYEQGAMISSGWLAAAALRGWSDERARLHFAKLGVALLEPWCTVRGREQLRAILAGEHDREPDRARDRGRTRARPRPARRRV